jgi:hypothetical protein
MSALQVSTRAIAGRTAVRRLLLFVLCLALGLGVGIVGTLASGSQWWFLAVPTVIAAGWLAVADPEQCLAKDGRRQGHDRAA